MNHPSSAESPLRTTTLTESLETLRDLADLVRSEHAIFVRYSEGPSRDQGCSVDTESGLTLPGISANPLHPEGWWTRPVEDWLARQVCQYRDLQEKNPHRFAWVLRGITVGRGPDCEPVLREVVPIARLSEALVEEAAARYRATFRAGHGPEQ